VAFDVEDIDHLAAGLLETGMAPAAAVALTTPETTLLARTYGSAPPSALWPIGSIGKSFTAVIALRRVEQGLLDLHAPVTDYVPRLSVRSRFGPITTHDLLTHTAGVVESSDLAPASTYDVIALAEGETGFAPGTHRHYSNVGYRAVGVILEWVTGSPHEELVQRHVLDRLGLTSTAAVMVHDTRRRLPGGNVPFYDDRPWELAHGLAPAPWVESAEADGCLCCSPEDLATYLRALWTGSELLSPASLAAMKQARPPQDAERRGTVTASRSKPTASGTRATCSVTSPTCEPTRPRGSGWWPSPTGSVVPGTWARARSPSPRAANRPSSTRLRPPRSSTTGPARSGGARFWGGFVPTTPGFRRSRSPRTAAA
jgi:CubicO group peptidase (beta-lactamase class C family)